MKILLFGGTGKLGSEIKKLRPDTIAPTRQECNITRYRQIVRVVDRYRLSIVIHAAALVGNKECEENKKLAWDTNVEGTINIVRVCRDLKIRLIFISSAAIFDGKKGYYKETDSSAPVFYYAIIKVAAEQAVKVLKNYAIIRLDFFPLNKLNQVFKDHHTSKIPVIEAARKIIRTAKSDFTGIINIGQKRNSLYKILKPFFPYIKPIRIIDSPLPNFPKDISLDLSKWNRLFPSLQTSPH